jgi:hypothetical protein
MTLSIEVPKSVEERLLAKARNAGMDLPTYAQRVLQADALLPPLEQTLAPIRESFARSGKSDDESAEEYEQEKHAAREAKRGIKFVE